MFRLRKDDYIHWLLRLFFQEVTDLFSSLEGIADSFTNTSCGMQILRISLIRNFGWKRVFKDKLLVLNDLSFLCSVFVNFFGLKCDSVNVIVLLLIKIQRNGLNQLINII